MRKRALITNVPPGDFPLADDPSGLELLERWVWHQISCGSRDLGWDEQVAWTRKAIEGMVESIRSRGACVWMNISGPFLPDGLIGIVGALINTDDGARFYVPAVESWRKGPGYVDSWVRIEYKRGYVDRVFENAGSILVASGTYVCFLFVPEEYAIESARWHLAGHVYRSRLTEDVGAALRESHYLISVGHDFDVMTVGARHEYRDALDRALALIG